MIETERLILRQWRPEDLDAYAALNADPQVMEHFPDLLSRDACADAVQRNRLSISAEGWGNWALERRSDQRLLGHVGIKPTGPELPFDGLFEAGWRMARHAWGCGYASEASAAALAYGFGVLNLPEIVAFTATANTRSQAVMQRLGMRREPHRDFEHPALPLGHALRPHVVYAVSSP